MIASQCDRCNGTGWQDFNEDSAHGCEPCSKCRKHKPFVREDFIKTEDLSLMLDKMYHEGWKPISAAWSDDNKYIGFILQRPV